MKKHLSIMIPETSYTWKEVISWDLKTLLEKDLIRIMGRKNLPGRPLIYGTTKKFLAVFDLKDLESLPKLKEIRDLGPEEEQTAPISDEELPVDQPDLLTLSKNG